MCGQLLNIFIPFLVEIYLLKTIDLLDFFYHKVYDHEVLRFYTLFYDFLFQIK